jgi:hypothetical protein
MAVAHKILVIIYHVLMDGTFYDASRYDRHDASEDYWARLDNALEGLTSEELAWRPQADCNPMGFIAWHMVRVEDRFVHHFAQGVEELWVKNQWNHAMGHSLRADEEPLKRLHKQ